MPALPIPNNLGKWANQPIVQDQVIAYMESIDAPMLLREIYHPLRLPRTTVNRVLGRLHAKGVLTRHKVQVRQHLPGRSTGSSIPDAATRYCFLYRFADEATG
jgi:predicted transcriptional regulator